jgi:hypothetical protein
MSLAPVFFPSEPYLAERLPVPSTFQILVGKLPEDSLDAVLGVVE